MSENNSSGAETAPKTEVTKPARALVPVQDESEASALLDSARFDQMQRVANAFASSDLVPAHYKAKPANCLIAISTALRARIDPMLFLQHTYMVSGKLGIDGQIAIAMLNSRGGFKGGVKFKWVGGSDRKADEFGCVAYGIDAVTGEVLEGPAVTWGTVKAEGWDKKDGSKWKTIPDLMFMYRSASWFGRTHRPEVLMGFPTNDELSEHEPRNVTPSAELLPSQIAEQAAEEHASSAEASIETAATEEKPEVEQTLERQAEDPDAPLNEARVKAIETAIKSVSMTDLQRKQFLATYGAETVEQIKNGAFQEVLRALMSWKPAKGK